MQQGKKWLLAGCILFAASFLLLYMARNIEGFAQWYTVTIYPVLVGSVGRLSGLIPFSCAEILLYICIILMIIAIIRKWLSQIVFVTGLLFLIYVVNCGINYHRDSFAECTQLQVEEYTVKELQQVCMILTEDINESASQVTRNADGVMLLTTNQSAQEAMSQLAKEFPQMEGYYPPPKSLLCSWILSVQKISGIYSPFTIEANYNPAMVDYNIPFTMCHELSHLRGFMQEQEANFIAYLACVKSDCADYQYSGSLLGWIHCMNTLYEADAEAWKEVREMLDEAVLPDLNANNAFWAQYDGRTAEVADMINDSYLKANGQSDGVKSYDKMVDLLVNYYK